MKKITCVSIIFLITGFIVLKSQEPGKITAVEKQSVIDIVAPEDVVVVEDEPTFVKAEVDARFQGGDLTKFREWVQKNLVYPPVAVENGIYGRIIIQFNVTSKGQVVETKILRGVDPSLDNEVIRVVMSSPLWEPAKQGGKPVKQQFVIPVIFSLGR